MSSIRGGGGIVATNEFAGNDAVVDPKPGGFTMIRSCRASWLTDPRVAALRGHSQDSDNNYRPIGQRYAEQAAPSRRPLAAGSSATPTPPPPPPARSRSRPRSPLSDVLTFPR